MKRLIRDNRAAVMMIVFFASSCVFAYCPVWIKAAFFSISFLFVILLLIRPVASRLFADDAKLKAAAFMITASLIVSSAVSFAANDLYAAGIGRAAGESETAYFRITGTDREYPYITYYTAETQDSALIPKGTDVMLATPVGGLQYGDVIFCEAEYSSLDERSTDTFDGRRYYQSHGIMIFAEAEEVDKIAEDRRFSLKHFFDGIRDSLASAVRAHCGRDGGGLAAAVLLGSKDGLSAAVKRDFRRLGISHLLVISGTHFSALIMLLEYALRRLRLGRAARACIDIVFILIFMGITGFTPSVLRAGVMHLLAQLSVIVARKPNNFNSYALSGALIVLINPLAVTDIGLQLSFASTLGCIVNLSERSRIFGKRRARRQNRVPRFVSRLMESVMITFTVTLFTLPLSWLYFGEISLVSIPANIVAVPVMTAFMYLSAVYLITYPLTVLVFPLSRLVSLFGSFIVSSAGKISHIGGVMIPIDFGFAPLFILPLAAMLLAFPFVRRKKGAAAVITSLFAVFVAASAITATSDRTNTYFSYVPVGTNEGFIVKSDGKVLAADMSNASIGYSYELSNEAKQYHVTELDTVLLTHYHNKHIPQFGSLCEREIVRRLVLPSPSTDAERAVYNGLCDTAAEYGVEVVTVADGESYTFGKAEITVSPRTYLTRTTHPVSGAAVRIAGEEIAVLPCSWNDGGDFVRRAANEAEYVFLGGHNPVYAERYLYSAGENLKLLSLSDAAYKKMEHYSREALLDVIVSEELTRLKWKLSPEK